MVGDSPPNPARLPVTQKHHAGTRATASAQFQVTSVTSAWIRDGQVAGWVGQEQTNLESLSSICHAGVPDKM